ncbi:MAG: signal peptidase I [Treponema sp.]|jgi:signal peptidase I|nr:signal peptidase I [Treponema sp.]
MFDRSVRYSYTAQKHERRRLLRAVIVLLVLFTLYNLISALFVSVWVLQNESMQPGLQAGDRFIVMSATLPSLLTQIRGTEYTSPFKRGQIVLVDTGLREQRKMSLVIADSIVRFCTAQRASIFAKEERLYFKRLIGLPGDEISMNNFVMRIRPAGDSYTLTEFELSDKPYYPNIPHVPALWDESLPFSGNMELLNLGTGECFVLSDDRSSTSDSRTWGPVPTELVSGRVVFRYWPLSRIGLP